MGRVLGAVLSVAFCAHPALALMAERSSFERAAQSASSKPTPFESFSKKAATAREAGRVEEAALNYGKALALRPDWVEGRLALATILFDLKRYPEAREHLLRLTAKPSGDDLALALLGLTSSRLHDYDTALATLVKARSQGIQVPGMLAAVVFETALLLNRAGNHDGAFDLLRGFVNEGEDRPTVIVALGLSVLRLRLMPDEVPLEKQEMVRFAGRGGYQMARARRNALGRLALEELVSRYPAEPNVHFALGMYLAPDDPDAAIEEFQRELRIRPDHVEALIQIAHRETRRGNPAAALPFAEKSVALFPDVPACRLVLGRALFDLERTAEAIVHLERAAALGPQSADVQFALSRAYQRAGRTADAERAREEFLRLQKSGK